MMFSALSYALVGIGIVTFLVSSWLIPFRPGVIAGTVGGFAPPRWADLDYQPTAADAADVLGRLATHPSAVGQIENMNRIQGSHYGNLIEIRELAVQLLRAVS